jgi:hypothetical protein
MLAKAREFGHRLPLARDVGALGLQSLADT